LEVLEEYGDEMTDSYWDKWEKREYKGRSGGVSWVDADRLREEAERVGVRDRGWVEGVCDRLKKGAVLGCRGEGRWPSSALFNIMLRRAICMGHSKLKRCPGESGRQVL
jgi:hypothetical protein